MEASILFIYQQCLLEIVVRSIKISSRMKMHIYRSKIMWMLVCPLLLLFTIEDTSLAQSSVNYQLINSVADQGGASSQSSNHEVVNAVGQPSPVAVSSSTNYTITSGFFAGRVANQSTSNESDIPFLYKEFQLFQNYPNPFNTMTTIRYSLPEAGQVKLEIYTILGRHVATLFNEYRTPGVYYVNYNGNTLSPGIYMYKIQTKHSQAIKKMSRMK